MCFDTDSHPPIAPISGAAVDAESITIKSEDGAEYRAYVARPAQSIGAGIVILPDVRGLHPFFEELAMRYAERGITALAIDYFCRTAGTGDRGNDFDYSPHVEATQWKSLQADIKAAVGYLRGLDPAPRSIFTTGFCMGGRLASVSATLGLGLAGAIPFYGWPTGHGRGGTPAPADVADKIECDLLIIYGEADQGISKDVRDTYDKALDKAGVKHETIAYPGAPHSFFDRKAEEYADASKDAWDRTLTFIRRHTMGQPIAG
ncbi:MAG TPA: dienelactone hydrolase family protein [Candidatus Limnocylindrales bacterium]|nr:dienelactone hydrolase family protein [Candidatus Limnocylindrales bacterium]